LFTVYGYPYKGKVYSISPNMIEIARNVPSLEKIIVVLYVNENMAWSELPKAILFEEALKEAKGNFKFEQISFDNPV